MKEDVQTVTIDGMAYLLAEDPEKIIKMFEAAGVKDFAIPARDPSLQLLTYDEAFILFIRLYLANMLKIKSPELNRIIREHGLDLHNRAEIIRIMDDEVLSIKIRLNKAKSTFIDWIENAPALSSDEDGDRKSEVGDQKSEVGGQRSEVGDQKSEVGDRKSEDGDRKSEVGGRKSEDGDRKSEVGDRKSEVGDQKSEVGDRKSEPNKPK